MANVPNGAETLRKISLARVGSMNVTDRRQTSERRHRANVNVCSCLLSKSQTSSSSTKCHVVYDNVDNLDSSEPPVFDQPDQLKWNDNLWPVLYTLICASGTEDDPLSADENLAKISDSCIILWWKWATNEYPYLCVDNVWVSTSSQHRLERVRTWHLLLYITVALLVQSHSWNNVKLQWPTY